MSDTESNLFKDYVQRKKTMNADIIYGDIDIDSMHNLEFVQQRRLLMWQRLFNQQSCSSPAWDFLSRSFGSG